MAKTSQNKVWLGRFQRFDDLPGSFYADLPFALAGVVKRKTLPASWRSRPIF